MNLKTFCYSQNLIFGGFLVLGTYGSLEWAENFATFYVFILAGVGLLYLDDDFIREMKKLGAPFVPYLTQSFLSFILLAIMIGYGWFWVGGLYGFHMLMRYLAIYCDGKTILEELGLVGKSPVRKEDDFIGFMDYFAEVMRLAIKFGVDIESDKFYPVEYWRAKFIVGESPMVSFYVAYPELVVNHKESEEVAGS